MCDKGIDSYQLALKFVFSNDDIILDDIGSNTITLFSNDIGLYSINLNNINLDDDNFDDCDLETIDHIRLMDLYNRNKQHRACKKR